MDIKCNVKVLLPLKKDINLFVSQRCNVGMEMPINLFMKKIKSLILESDVRL